MLKRLSIISLLVVFSVVGSGARPRYQDAKTKPPEKATAEYTAIEFVKRLVAKDKKGCLELVDEKGEQLYEIAGWDYHFKQAEEWRLDDLLKYKKRLIKGGTKVSVQTKNRDGSSLSIGFIVRQKDGKWYISS